MLLLLLLISLLPNLNLNRDTVRQDTIKNVSLKKSVRQSNATMDKLDSLLIKFNKLDSLTKK